jgi:bacterioferritin-associated ferredoxin
MYIRTVTRPPSIQTLADLHYTQRVYASCGPCQRAVALDVRQLIERHGPLLTIDEVRRRIKCARCGKRTHDIRIVYSVAKGPRD